MSFGAVNDLKTLESVCKLTNNSSEVKDIVTVIRQDLKDIKLTDEVVDIQSSLTENLKNQADANIFFRTGVWH